MDTAFFNNLDILDNIMGVGLIAATGLTYVFAPYFKKTWTDSQKFKEAIYVRELLDTKKSLQVVLDETCKATQPVFYEKIEALLNDINDEIVLYVTKQKSSSGLKDVLKGSFKLSIFKKIHRNWVDVLSSIFFGFWYWIVSFGAGFAIADEYLDTSSSESDIALYPLLIIVTLSIFFATSYAYKKYFTYSGFLPWVKKNILVGVYAMFFAFCYLVLYWLILLIVT